MVLFIAAISEVCVQTYLEVRGGYTRNQLSHDFESVIFEDAEASGGGYAVIIATHYITQKLLFKFGSERMQKKYLLLQTAPFNPAFRQSTIEVFTKA